MGVFAGLTSLYSSNYSGLCLWSGAALPCIAIVYWLSLWVYLPTTILPLTFVLLLFPDSRLTRRFTGLDYSSRS